MFWGVPVSWSGVVSSKLSPFFFLQKLAFNKYLLHLYHHQTENTYQNHHPMKKYFTSAGVALIMSLVFSSISTDLSAQCKGFVNEQLDLLSPYLYSGKTNTTVLSPGDHSELALTFYSGQTYRLLMRSTERTANIAFTVKDSKGNLVFKSTSEDQADYYDFTSETTQAYTVEMIALETGPTAQMGPSQCVVVMVGEKE